MLEGHARPPRSGRREADLDLGDELLVELPLGRQLPSEHHSAGRVPDQDVAPVAFRAVDPDLCPAALRSLLQHDRLHRRLVDVMLRRPPGFHLLGENLESAIRRRFDDNLRPNTAHDPFSFSTASLNAANALFQKRSRYPRIAAMARKSIW